jgi:hypothetical protein
VSDKVGHAADRTKEGASHLGGSLSEHASRGSQSAQDAIASAHHSAGDISSRAAHGLQENYRAVDQRFRSAVEEVPLGVGLGFLGLGVFAGLLLPRSEREDELLGETADDLRHAASDKGEDLMERGKTVAARVADKAVEEAENQGLTPEAASSSASELTDKVESVVHEAKREGKDATQAEGLTPEQARAEAEKESSKLSEEAKKRVDD